jgi:hypothetical protein
VAYPINYLDPPSPHEQILQFAMKERLRKREAALRELAIQFIREGYHLNELESVVQRSDYTIQQIWNGAKAKEIVRVHATAYFSKRQLNFRKRMRMLSGGGGWQTEKKLGLWR